MNLVKKLNAWIQNTILNEKFFKMIWARIAWLGNRLRPRARFKNTKAYAALMQMPPLKRRMTVMLVSVFILLGLIKIGRAHV